MTDGRGRHLISLRDLTDEQLTELVRRSVDFATGRRDPAGALRGRIVGVLFTKTSTRTRTAFTAGALRLGAQVVTYGPGDLQLNTGETMADTARVLGGMLDALVARTAGPEAELRTLSRHLGTVINAMSAQEHPTQALADLSTMRARFGDLTGLRVLYVGEGNNTASALALALPRLGIDLELRTPPGYGLPPALVDEARALGARSGGRIRQRHDMAALPARVDVVYTTRWQTTGTTKPDPRWRRVFAPFAVDAALMARCPDAVFLHDLPAHRGEEVAAEVLDGPASLAFEQARHKLHSAMAALHWALGE
ncbi:ornithine carbamoyltransferase [Micromonospora sp. WMMD998]|uniref:ornithine carbamoyltransferase n=1 Tax=Micromonospora sp. WMMD998 TaxID=3016092 RepID=UPI00249CEA21|nr:ornithine carbamoyltransferase [Micromonospora sp. WMMD998]WFE41014.1 ornithine carbamoyltransferase [Micromonospora sp. WMMD998]